MPDLDLDAIQAAAEKATPGPWSAADEHGDLGPDACPAWCVSRMGDLTPNGPDERQYLYDVAYTTGTNEQADAEFIATANPSVVAALVERVKQAEAIVAEAKCEMDELMNCARGTINHAIGARFDFILSGGTYQRFQAGVPVGETTE